MDLTQSGDFGAEQRRDRGHRRATCSASKQCSGRTDNLFMPCLHGRTQDGAPDLDLLALVAADPAGLLATLDPEVAADVTAAAHLLAQRVLAGRAPDSALGFLS